MYVTTTRVPVKYGHMAVIHAVLTKDVDTEYIINRLSRFRSLPPQERELPTAPREPIKVINRVDAPQPTRDLDPMAVSVGRVLVRDRVLRLVALGDNLVRGAAGITILTVETMKALGIL